MITVIEKWFGRTGNNIVQIINCMYWSFKIKKDIDFIVLPKHVLLKTRIIYKRDSIENNDPCFKKNKMNINNLIETNRSNNRVYTDANNYFYGKKLGFNLEPSQMRKIAQEYLTQNILNLNLNDKSIGDNELYIHIRAGDIMRDKYFFLLPNPLSFYKRLINEQRWKKIHIIYENKDNPVIDELMKLKNDKLNFQSLSIREDLNELLKAKHFSMSFSTFGLIIYFLSKNIKNILIPKFMLDHWFKDQNFNINMEIYSFDDDYSINSWKSMSNKQKKKILIKYSGTIKNQIISIK